MSSVLEQMATEAGKDPVIIRRIAAPLFWAWYALHRRDRVRIPARFWRRSVSIEELRPFLAEVFGTEVFNGSKAPGVQGESEKDPPRWIGART